MSDFNPLDPKQTAHPDSFAARIAARKAMKEGVNANDALANIDVSALSEAERYQLIRNNAIQQAEKDFKFNPAAVASEKITIVFDDSISMAYDKIDKAHKGVIKFMRDCVPNETAIKIQPLNAAALSFTCDLPALAARVKNIKAIGGTPLYATTQNAMLPDEDITPTRMILFSDGEPANAGHWLGLNRDNPAEYIFSNEHIATIKIAKEKHIPLDTCLIADVHYKKTDSEYLIMKNLAEETGGIFIVFEEGKLSIEDGLKYLTKGSRLLLMDSNFKAALEEGKI